MIHYEIRGLRDWIDNILGFELYDELPMGSRVDFQTGQFYSAHVKYPFVSPLKVLELENYDAEDEGKTTYKIASFDEKVQAQSHFPIKSLNLRSDERLYILVGKPRTVIVLGNVESEWLKKNNKKKDKIVLCLPVASFHEQHSADDIVSIQLFEIPHLFYIKPAKKGAFLEGAARFELIQPVQIGELQPVKNSNNLPFKLSSDPLKLLFNHFLKFSYGVPLSSDLDSDIGAFRDLMKQDMQTSK